MKIIQTCIFLDGRETNVRVRLPRGKYCIIPSTFQPDQEGDFILRVHIERYSREEVRTILIFASIALIVINHYIYIIFDDIDLNNTCISG